jgi:hypothetical protein
MSIEQRQTQTQQKQQPIFIDCDSHCFSFTLDCMRDNRVVELPITISKESFVWKLKYFGFRTTLDVGNNNTYTTNGIWQIATNQTATWVLTQNCYQQLDKHNKNTSAARDNKC